MTPPATTPPSSMDEPSVEESSIQIGSHHDVGDSPRPHTHRRATEPSRSTSPPLHSKPSSLPLRPRNRSPYARSYLRTRSSLSSLSTSSVTRSYSTPVVDISACAPSVPYRPTSPLPASGRHQSPRRRPLDEIHSSLGGQFDIGETISENSELHLTPRQSLDAEASPSSPLAIHHTFPRSRRRPSSPLHHIIQSPLHSGVSPLHSSASSPILASTAKFNESYPSTYSLSSSSMPSTPTSFRSRSPSISSLETIPDSPDAEQEAQEAYNIARLKAAADRECEREFRRRTGSLDVNSRGSEGMGLGTNGFGVVFGSRDKRKRWSVCGAERRGDLDLETIWED